MATTVKAQINCKKALIDPKRIVEKLWRAVVA
jgi:hypothetical protein